MLRLHAGEARSQRVAAHSDRGSVIPLLIGFLVIMVSMTALIVDTGYMRSRHLMLVSTAEQVATTSAQGVRADTAAASLVGRPGERLLLDPQAVRSLAAAAVADLGTGWRNLRLASVVVRDRAAVVKLCADFRLPLPLSLPVRRSGNGESDVHTMCVSAAAALALSPPQ